MHSRIIAIKEPKHVFPKEISEKIVKGHTTAIGLALISPKDGKIMSHTGMGETSFEDFKTNQETFKDSKVVYTFVEAVDAIAADDLQPFVLSKDEKPVVACFLAGAFESHAHPGSTHTNELHFFENYLRHKIKDMLDREGGDVDKLFAVMQGGVFKAEMEAMCTPSNSIVFFLANGETLAYSKEANAAYYPFGALSNDLGFKFEEPKKSALAAIGDLVGLGKKVELPKDTVISSGPTVVDAREALAKMDQGKTDTAIQTVEATVIRVKPPAGLSNKQTKTWYHNNAIGGLPKGWDDRVEVAIKPDSKLYASLKAKQSGVVEPANITVKSEHIPAPATGPVLEVMPVIPATQKKTIRDDILQNAKTIMAPERIQELEDKYPSFVEIAGYKDWSDLYPWSFARYLELVQKCPESAALLAMNAIYRMKLLAQSKASPKEEGDEYMPFVEPAKVEPAKVVPPAPVAAPVVAPKRAYSM